MFPSFNDPFAAMTALQRALKSRLQSDWIGASTSAAGSYPPINIFQQNDDFVAVIELAGVEKDDLQIEAKESTVRISGRRRRITTTRPACTGASACLAYSTARCRCRCRSTPTGSAPNIETVCSPCSFRAPRARSRAPSRSTDDRREDS